MQIRKAKPTPAHSRTKRNTTMYTSTQDALSAHLNQARGVLAYLLADAADLKEGCTMSPEIQGNALWAVDSLLAQAQKEVNGSSTEHGGSRQGNPL